jgi:hypothetical protein
MSHLFSPFGNGNAAIRFLGTRWDMTRKLREKCLIGRQGCSSRVGGIVVRKTVTAGGNANKCTRRGPTTLSILEFDFEWD